MIYMSNNRNISYILFVNIFNKLSSYIQRGFRWQILVLQKKRIRQDEKKNRRNKDKKTALRSSIKAIFKF